jgi:hypothetical protein
VFRRVLQLVDDAADDEVVLFSKIDLSDGFWRMLVEAGQQWNFTYVMPGPPDSSVRIVVPSQLQMGWAESPAYFCAATETGRDHIQGLVESNTQLPPHEFKEYIRPLKAPKRSRSDAPPHGVWFVLRGRSPWSEHLVALQYEWNLIVFADSPTSFSEIGTWYSGQSLHLCRTHHQCGYPHVAQEFWHAALFA